MGCLESKDAVKPVDRHGFATLGAVVSAAPTGRALSSFSDPPQRLRRAARETRVTAERQRIAAKPRMLAVGPGGDGEDEDADVSEPGGSDAVAEARGSASTSHGRIKKADSDDDLLRGVTALVGRSMKEEDAASRDTPVTEGTGAAASRAAPAADAPTKGSRRDKKSKRRNQEQCTDAAQSPDDTASIEVTTTPNVDDC